MDGTWSFQFCVACGAPGSFFEGGGEVLCLQIFVKEASVEAVAAGGCVERGDFFGWAGGEVAAGSGVSRFGAPCNYDYV